MSWTRRRPPRWALGAAAPIRFAAAVWALLFGAGSLYLAAGGTVGLGLVADSIRHRVADHDPGILTALWLYGTLKVVAAGLPLLIPVLGGAPRRLARAMLGISGVGFLLWGAAYEAVGGAIVAGVRPVPPDWGEGAATWYVLLWGPMWMVGGALFLTVAHRCRPRRSERRGSDEGAAVGNR